MGEALCLIRSYNNPALPSRIAAILESGLDSLVITNARVDDGATRRMLSEFDRRRVELVELDEYSWTSALNRGIWRAARAGVRFLFPMSVEALFDDKSIDQMLAAAAIPGVALVGTTFALVGELGAEVPQPGRGYRSVRNTGMVIDLEEVSASGAWFDSRCDQDGGMEDVDLAIRLQVLRAEAVRLLDLQVPLVVGKHYDQAAKDVREAAALAAIVDRWRRLAGHAGREREELDVALRTLGLASM